MANFRQIWYNLNIIDLIKLLDRLNYMSSLPTELVDFTDLAARLAAVSTASVLINPLKTINAIVSYSPNSESDTSVSGKSADNILREYIDQLNPETPWSKFVQDIPEKFLNTQYWIRIKAYFKSMGYDDEYYDQLLRETPEFILAIVCANFDSSATSTLMGIHEYNTYYALKASHADDDDAQISELKLKSDNYQKSVRQVIGENALILHKIMQLDVSNADENPLIKPIMSANQKLENDLQELEELISKEKKLLEKNLKEIDTELEFNSDKPYQTLLSPATNDNPRVAECFLQYTQRLVPIAHKQLEIYTCYQLKINCYISRFSEDPHFPRFKVDKTVVSEMIVNISSKFISDLQKNYPAIWEIISTYWKDISPETNFEESIEKHYSGVHEDFVSCSGNTQEEKNTLIHGVFGAHSKISYEDLITASKTLQRNEELDTDEMKIQTDRMFTFYKNVGIEKDKILEDFWEYFSLYSSYINGMKKRVHNIILLKFNLCLAQKSQEDNTLTGGAEREQFKSIIVKWSTQFVTLEPAPLTQPKSYYVVNMLSDFILTAFGVAGLTFASILAIPMVLTIAAGICTLYGLIQLGLGIYQKDWGRALEGIAVLLFAGLVATCIFTPFVPLIAIGIAAVVVGVISLIWNLVLSRKSKADPENSVPEFKKIIKGGRQEENQDPEFRRLVDKDLPSGPSRGH